MDRDVKLRKETLQQSPGKNYLLAIGIDQYEHHPHLKNAVADAKAFVTVMQNRYGFELLTEFLKNKAIKE
jgi:formylglycine-generating enzyme